MASTRQIKERVRRQAERLEEGSTLRAFDSYNTVLAETLEPCGDVPTESPLTIPSAKYRTNGPIVLAGKMRASAQGRAGLPDAFDDKVEANIICFPYASMDSFPGASAETYCTKGSMLHGFISRGGRRFFSIKAVVNAELDHLRRYRKAVNRKLAEYEERTQRLRSRKLRRFLLHGGREEDFFFLPKPFRAPVYKPKYYDFGCSRAVVPVVPPVASTAHAKHPVQHVQWDTPVTQATLSYDHTTEWKYMYSHEYKLRVSGPSTAAPLIDEKGMPVFAPSGASIGGPLTATARSLASVPDFDREKCATAVRSCLLRSKVIVDVPQFVIEFRDIFKTIQSFMNLIREIGAVSCRGLDTVLRKTRPPTRFGMTNCSIWQRALGKMGKTSQDVFQQHQTQRFADRMVRKVMHGRSAADEVLLYELVDMADALTGADLAYKFGFSPAVRDVCNTARLLMGKLDAFWRQVDALVKWNGKPLRFHRVVSDTATLNKSTVDPIMQATGLIGSFDYGNGECSTHEWAKNVKSAWSACQLPRERSCVITDRVRWTATPTVTFFLRSLAGLPLTDDEIVEGAILDAFGLNVFRPSLLWDLLPFSFVVDWFADIGALIEQFDVYRIRPEPLWDTCVITRCHQHVERLQAFEGHGSVAADSWMNRTATTLSFKDGAQTVRYKRFERWLIDPEDMLPLEFEQLKHPVTGWWEKITGAELVYQLLS